MSDGSPMTINPVKEEAVTPEMIVTRGYWGPDVDGDWVVDILGPDLAFAVADEGKAKAVVVAILTMRQADPRIAELEAALRLARSYIVPGRNGSEVCAEIDAVLNRKEG